MKNYRLHLLIALLNLLLRSSFNIAANGGNTKHRTECHWIFNDYHSIQNLKKFRIVPEVIGNVPDECIYISYTHNVRVLEGNTLDISQVSKQPDVRYTSDAKKLYTLMMVDPDAPIADAPVLGQILHWLVVNIPRDFVNNGDTLAEYIPSMAVDPHRYTFVLYEQSGKFKKVDKITLLERINFSAIDYARKNKLTLKAANFFIAGLLNV